MATQISTVAGIRKAINGLPDDAVVSVQIEDTNDLICCPHPEIDVDTGCIESRDGGVLIVIYVEVIHDNEDID